MCQIRPKTERRRGDVLGRRSICRDADRLSVVFNSKSLGFRSERRRDKPDQTGSQSLPHRNPTGNHSTRLRQNRPETERRRDELGRKLLDVVIDPTKVARHRDKIDRKSVDVDGNPTENRKLTHSASRRTESSLGFRSAAGLSAAGSSETGCRCDGVESPVGACSEPPAASSRCALSRGELGARPPRYTELRALDRVTWVAAGSRRVVSWIDRQPAPGYTGTPSYGDCCRRRHGR